ncbi:MAG: hypothetical protein NT071_00610, partial [Burkholderiales bacterium]|nr:hypothetical protein [Burkholderiales bacterium]
MSNMKTFENRLAKLKISFDDRNQGYADAASNCTLACQSDLHTRHLPRHEGESCQRHADPVWPSGSGRYPKVQGGAGGQPEHRHRGAAQLLGGKERRFSDDYVLERTFVGFHGHYDANGRLNRQLVERLGLLEWIIKYSDGKADRDLVKRWINIE